MDLGQLKDDREDWVAMLISCLYVRTTRWAAMTERLFCQGGKNAGIVADFRSSLAEPRRGKFDPTNFLSCFCHPLPIH